MHSLLVPLRSSPGPWVRGTKESFYTRECDRTKVIWESRWILQCKLRERGSKKKKGLCVKERPAGKFVLSLLLFLEAPKRQVGANSLHNLDLSSSDITSNSVFFAGSPLVNDERLTF